jgi:hypothetical protein
MRPQSLPSTIPTQNDRCTPSVTLRSCVQGDNPMTRCLKRENAVWNAISTNPAFALMKLPARYQTLLSPFDVMPYDALRLNQSGSFPISGATVANRYYTVFSYLVPAGMNGVINVTVNKFVPSQTGPDFQDGSGQLTWALGINNYLALNYTNIGITMGSNAVLGPVAHDGGIRIQANDTISFYIKASAGGLAYLDPAGIILCAIQGWLYSAR